MERVCACVVCVRRCGAERSEGERVSCDACIIMKAVQSVLYALFCINPFHKRKRDGLHYKSRLARD